jgi:hypothetical protein
VNYDLIHKRNKSGDALLNLKSLKIREKSGNNRRKHTGKISIIIIRYTKSIKTNTYISISF